MRALLVEDDETTQHSVSQTLRSEGHVCDCTESGEDGAQVARMYDYDVIILDVMLPDIDGHDVLRKLRAFRVRTPVLVLSGLTGTDQKVKSLGCGADDYITKPFDKRELVARMNAVVRRAKGHADNVIEIGDISIDIDARAVRVRENPIRLTGREYAVLELMALRKGNTVSKETFLNHLYGGMDEPDTKILDVFVCKLRKKLETTTGGARHIETVWGHGYKLREPHEVA